MPAAFGWILPLGGLAIMLAGAVLFPSREAMARNKAAVARWKACARRHNLEWRSK